MTRVGTTSFSDIYQSFLSKITDDMYMELTPEDTYKMLEDLLISSIPKFEFPRFDIFNYTLGSESQSIASTENTSEEEGESETEVTTNDYTIGFFNTVLTTEEINILATYMVVE